MQSPIPSQVLSMSVKTFLLGLKTLFEQKYPTRRPLFATPALCWLEFPLRCYSVVKLDSLAWDKQTCGSLASSDF